MFISLLLVATAVGAPSTPAPAVCHFEKTRTQWEGSCGRLFDQESKMTLNTAKGVATGRWRKDASPTMVYAGEMTDSGNPNDKIELELYGAVGVLRTAQGWYAVEAFSVDAMKMSFQLDTLNEIPPSDLDRDIIRRAAAILSTNAVWNRHDNRECPANATTWSIYCAMQRASVEVTGGAHHRRPGMELVRREIERRSVGRNYQHRLMDYNNDSGTTLADVHSVFNEVLARKYFALAEDGASPFAPIAANKVAASAPTSPSLTFVASDLKIVQRARDLLATSATWNQTDGQNCVATAKTFALYCALKKASEDVTGSFDHDGAVMNEAREVIDFVAARKYGARLVDYNNDATTTVADIQALLRIMQNRIVRQTTKAP